MLNLSGVKGMIMNMKKYEDKLDVVSRWLLISLFALQFVLPAAIEVLKVPSAVSYVYDLVLIVLLCITVVRRKFHVARDVRIMLLWIFAFIAFVTVTGMARLQSFFYFLWAFRNNFRVYVVFFAVILFSEKEDWKYYSSLIDFFLMGSFVASLIQFFVLDLRNDYVGGLFGTSIGCNGYMNLFLCIAVTKSLVLYFHGREKLWRTGLIVFSSLVIATLSELKFFYIEFGLIMLASACITPYSKKKLYILAGAVFLCVAGVGCLYVIYPQFRNFFSVKEIADTVFSSNYSTSGDLNRLTGYATVTKRFLNTPCKFLFGLGLGNCEYSSSFSFLTSPFYLKYNYLNYYYFQGIWTFLENGFIGLLFLFGFFVLIAVFSAVRLCKANEGEKPYYQISIILCCISALCILYNSSLQIPAGYMVYAVVALPFSGNVPEKRGETVPDKRNNSFSQAVRSKKFIMMSGIVLAFNVFLCVLVVTPLPLEKNRSDINRRDGAPVFSADGGFYSKAFFLRLSGNKDDTIYYTIDGSDPVTSKTAKKYSHRIFISPDPHDNKLSARTDICITEYHAPENVDKAMVVRAVCVNKEMQYGPVITNTYFIGKLEIPSYTVISLTTDYDNLFDPETGIYVLGTQYDEWKQSEEYQEKDVNSTENVTNYNSAGREWERPCNMQVFKNGKTDYSADCGMRIQGNWSRGFAQKSFKLYARKEYGTGKFKYDFFGDLYDVNGKKINKFESIVLHNGGSDCELLHGKDELVSDLAVGLNNVAVSAVEPCILYLNGEYWGFYYIREKVDEHFIASHYGVDADAVAFVKNFSCEQFPKRQSDFTSFVYWACSADLRDDANYRKVCATVDADSLIDYITVETFFLNYDWADKLLNNMAWWRAVDIDKNDPYMDGKWRLVLFDCDQSFSFSVDYDYLGNMYAGSNRNNVCQLFYRLLLNDDFRLRFEERYSELITTRFSQAAAEEVLAQYVSYRDEVEKTGDRFGFSMCSFDRKSEEINEFFRMRPEYAMADLAAVLEQYEGDTFMILNKDIRVKETLINSAKAELK